MLPVSLHLGRYNITPSVHHIQQALLKVDIGIFKGIGWDLNPQGSGVNVLTTMVKVCVNPRP